MAKGTIYKTKEQKINLGKYKLFAICMKTKNNYH